MHTDTLVSFPLETPLLLVLSAAGVLGAIVGSFIGAALERMPQGRSVVTGRSACDSCGTALTVQELVPVLSWLVQRGRCRTCDAPIGVWQIVCELGAAAIAMIAVLAAEQVPPLVTMVLGWQLLLLALLDLRHLWLPRVLTAMLAASGVMLAAARAWAFDDWPGDDWSGIAIPLAGGALGFGMLWLVATAYRRVRGRDGMGGGDLLLMGAIGLWVGPLGVVHTLLGASIIGLLAAAVMHFAGRKIQSDTALPLGTCLAAAAFPVFLLQGLV